MHDGQNNDDYANPLPIKEALYQTKKIASPMTRTLYEMSEYSKKEMESVLHTVQSNKKIFAKEGCFTPRDCYSY